MDTNNYPSTAIYSHAELCLDLFRQLYLKLESKNSLSNEEDQCLDLPDDAITDAMGRFKVWAGNIGVFQRNKASLDYRLGHADVRIEVERLLKQLQLNMKELLEIACGVRRQQTWSSSDVDEFFFDYEDSDEDESESKTVEGYSSSTQPESMTESKELYSSMLESITSLFKLSMFIRRSSRANKFLKSSIEQKYDAQFDIMHIRDKYPFATRIPGLIERLGKANAQRRQWLMYKKRHREKLAVQVTTGMEGSGLPPNSFSTAGLPLRFHDRKEVEEWDSVAQTIDPLRSATVLSSTVATSFHGLSPDDFDTDRNSEGFSETSYAESKIEDSEHEPILVPQPPPESADQSPFECPYCFTIISISGFRSWTKHVHSDLASYTCTQSHCSHPLFESRHQWFNHELEAHRQQWICDVCGKIMVSANSFNQHMNQEHSGSFVASQLPALTARAERPMRRISASACPLCDYNSILRKRFQVLDGASNFSEPLTVTMQHFRSHLGRHLEQLALFVLPKKALIEQSDCSASSQEAEEGIGAISETDVNSRDGEEISKDNLFAGTELGSDDVPAVHGVTKPSEDKADFQHDAYDPDVSGALVDEYGSILEEPQTDEGPTPDLAMGWQPPMDFQPPAEDFEEDDIDWLPRREDSLFGGDLFTPGWVRGYGADKEGFCGRCEPGIWHRILDNSYHFHITYKHGISSSGIPLPRPSSIRRHESRPGQWEGYCDACQQWQLLEKTWMGWNWFAHFVKKHGVALDQKLISDRLEERYHQYLEQRHDQAVRKLIRCIKSGDYATFKSMMYAKPELIFPRKNIRSRRSVASTLLHHAAEVGNAKSVRILLENPELYLEPNTYQSFLNAQSSNGKTALALATEGGHREVIDILTAANKEASDILSRRMPVGGGEASLQDLAVRAREGSQFPYHEGSLEEQTNLLITSVMRCDIRSVESLIENHIDIEASSSDGKNALIVAASFGHLDILRILLSAGANINATTVKGWTSLMITVKNRDKITTEFLLSQGADVNHLSPDRWTALTVATCQSEIMMMKTLIDFGADTETKSSHDWTPLMHAAYKGDTKSVDLLLEAGADVHAASQRDETSLLLGAAGGYTEIVRILLLAGCVPEPAWASNSDVPPSGGAVEGTSLNARAMALGWTPLMLACQIGSGDIAQMLLDRGVSLETRSPYRKNALEIAKENGRDEMVELLENHIARSTTAAIS